MNDVRITDPARVTEVMVAMAADEHARMVQMHEHAWFHKEPLPTIISTGNDLLDAVNTIEACRAWTRRMMAAHLAAPRIY